MVVEEVLLGSAPPPGHSKASTGSPSGITTPWTAATRLLKELATADHVKEAPEEPR